MELNSEQLIGMVNTVISEICKSNNTNIGSISDGFHTFDELYHHRTILLSIVCNQNNTKSWKSKLHHDGTMYDGMFIVGISTIFGQITYHCEMRYWQLFAVPELKNAPEWDGHTPEDVTKRLMTFSTMANGGECDVD